MAHRRGENDLPEIGEVWRLLLAEAPDLVAELALIAAAAEDLPRLLADGPRPADSAPLPMIEHLLHGSPVSAAGIDLACDALGEIAARWPAGRPLRVLEIGADGGATRRLLDRLAQSGARVQLHRDRLPIRSRRRGSALWLPARRGERQSAGRRASRPTNSPTAGSTSIVAAHACARLQIDTAGAVRTCASCLRRAGCSLPSSRAQPAMGCGVRPVCRVVAERQWRRGRRRRCVLRRVGATNSRIGGFADLGAAAVGGRAVAERGVLGPRGR